MIINGGGEVKDRTSNNDTRKNLRIYKYNIFKERAKLLLTYKT